MKTKNITILGSTGSIGRSTLDVIIKHPGAFNVVALAAFSNVELIVEQFHKFQPKYICLVDESKREELETKLKNSTVNFVYGEDELVNLAKLSENDMVVNAVVGSAGLLASLATVNNGIDLGLANKESLVTGGPLFEKILKKTGAKILPIDSEHSAIWQTLAAGKPEEIKRLIITASGGPFRTMPKEEFASITPEKALDHPTWKMGPKISIDSATLANKGLEVIEARWLFDLKPEQIDVIIHPQSVIHSLVQFTDGSLKAQLSSPNMQLPIQYALHYPNRGKNALSQFSLTDHPELTFRQADRKKFRNLALAIVAMKQGGNMPAILNAANEVAVQSFLNGKWPFYRISELVEEMMNQQNFISKPDLETYFETTQKCFAESEAYIRKHT